MGDHYQILGLARDASKTDIKNAFFRLAHRYHPDHQPQADAAGCAEAARRFREAKGAYDVLSDDRRRAEYDRQFQRSSFSSGNKHGGSSSSSSSDYRNRYSGGTSGSSSSSSSSGHGYRSGHAGGYWTRKPPPKRGGGPNFFTMLFWDAERKTCWVWNEMTMLKYAGRSGFRDIELLNLASIARLNNPPPPHQTRGNMDYPTSGYCKINVEAVVRKQGNTKAMDVVCRHDGGSFLGVSAIVIHDIDDHVVLEALSCRKEPSLTLNLQLTRIRVAFDCRIQESA